MYRLLLAFLLDKKRFTYETPVPISSSHILSQTPLPVRRSLLLCRNTAPSKNGFRSTGFRSAERNDGCTDKSSLRRTAPATLVGFTDMFIPALLSVGLASVKTKFVIGVLSLIQIIYLTEVRTIIIKSEIPLNFWKLLVIFLERTIIAIPLIVLFANIIGL